jgi:hypothetical protein
MKAALQRVIDYSNTIKTKLGNAFSTWDEIINPQGASPVTEKNLDIRTSDDYLKKFGGK